MSRTPTATIRLARKTALAQLLAGAVVAVLLGALYGLSAAAAAAIGALAIGLGTILMGRALLEAGVSSATGALMRLVVGVFAKWVLVLVLCVLAIGVLKLPPLPLLAGLVVALAASAVAAIMRR